MAKSRLAGIGALRCVVPPLCALFQTGRLIGRHCQCTSSLGIAASDGGLSFGPGQSSLASKSGTSEQHCEQDAKHKAHDVTPSWLSSLPHKATHGTDQLLVRSFPIGSKLKRHPIVSGHANEKCGVKKPLCVFRAVRSNNFVNDRRWRRFGGQFAQPINRPRAALITLLPLPRERRRSQISR